MINRFISRGFVGKRREPNVANRVPPGQYLTRDFLVLSAGPTPICAWSSAHPDVIARLSILPIFGDIAFVVDGVQLLSFRGNL